MNSYIHSQILNMIAVAKTFEQGCIMGAMKNDGRINPDEAKTIKRIKAVTEKFIKELEAIK